MSEFYEIDSTRVSHREMLMWHKSPLVLIGWLNKWVRVRIPCSSDDPNTDSTLPFVTESLPPVISEKFIELAHEIAGLGFSDPVHHVIHDAGTRTTIYWATFRHDSGKYFARIHQRIWQAAQKPDRGTFLMFFTAFTDWTFLVSSAGKPDMAEPATVQMNRMPQAATMRLWEKHQQLSGQLESRKNVTPVRSVSDLTQLTEQYHILTRDYHLARGVFRPRTSVEHTQVEAYTTSLTQAQASGVKYPEVMAELERLQNKKSVSRNTLLLLIISVGLFIGVGARQWDWKFTLWLIPILLIHESGHWVAMKIFHYRNLRMFFIPLFGAAVMGQNWNVPGWKKALVSLAGPLPGIALGVILGVAGLATHNPWLDKAALLLVILNGLNLLPFLPLDGGHVVHVTLFCRNRWLDILFRVVAVGGLMLLSYLGILGRVSFFLAIFMAVGLPVAFKLGQITDSLRKAGLPPPLPGENGIPPATAEAIIAALNAAKLPGGASNKALAQHTLNIYETLNAHPPGVLGTTGILLLHGVSFFVAIVFVGILLLGEHGGGLGNFFSAALNQAAHPVACTSVQTSTGESAGTNPPPVINLLVATFKDHRRAENAYYNEIKGHTRAGDRAALFGDSILLALPADDDSARRDWFTRFQSMAPGAFVAPTNMPVNVNLSFIAPTLTVATNLEREMNDYLLVTAGMHLIPPWSPAAHVSEFDASRHARREWQHIDAVMNKAFSDPAMKAVEQKLSQVMKSGDHAQGTRLEEEQTKTLQEVRARLYEQLRTDKLDPVDPDLLALHARQETLFSETNAIERAAVLQALAPKLGQVGSVDGHPVPGADDYGASFGLVTRSGLLIEISYLPLNNAAVALPALANWLCDQNCTSMRYDILGVAETSDDSN